MSSKASDSHSEHPPHLAHHFDTPQQQFEAAGQGMWLFLATEILLFGGLFCAYAVYRANHPEVFVYAHKYLSVKWGAINTIILLCSSFTMAAAVWAAQHGYQRMLVTLLALTIAGALGFLGIKFVEYEHKWKEGLLWGKLYDPHAPPGAHGVEEHGTTQPGEQHDEPEHIPEKESPYAATEAETAPTTSPHQAVNEPEAAVTDDDAWMFHPADTGPRGLLMPERAPVRLEPDREVRNVQLFFSIYFAMTGLHGIHVIAGIGAIAWVLVLAARGRFGPEYFTPVPLVGLYWHVVDLIWIYLFPLLYLIH